MSESEREKERENAIEEGRKYILVKGVLENYD